MTDKQPCRCGALDCKRCFPLTWDLTIDSEEEVEEEVSEPKVDYVCPDHAKQMWSSVKDENEECYICHLASRWINSKEQLPGVGQAILCYEPRVPASCWNTYSTNFGMHGYEAADTWAERITHWMPLPEPPEKA